MSAPSIAEFYAPEHIGGRFGILPNSEFYGPNGHRGQDIKGWAGGTIIPSFISGTIITREYQSGLGNCIVVRSGLGLFYGFAHLQTLPLYNYIGDHIMPGAPIGPLGSTGSLTDGNHVHITKSDTSRFPWTGPVRDPLPDIEAARYTYRNGDPAGLPSTPLPPKPKRMDPDMALVIRRNSTGTTWTVAPGNYIKHEPTAEERDLAIYTHNPGGQPTGYSDADLAKALWDLGFPELGGNIDVLPYSGGIIWARRGQ